MLKDIDYLKTSLTEYNNSSNPFIRKNNGKEFHI
jgi:hypothetical protein